MIRRGTRRDAPALASICNHYIADGHWILREDPVEPSDMESRLGERPEDWPAFVLEEQGHVLGYSYAGEWWGPKIEAATLETTIYLTPEACGRGFGSALYTTLLEALAERDVHTAIGCIALPNEASLALHASLGFTKLTRMQGAAEKFGRRFDLECWARLLRPD